MHLESAAHGNPIAGNYSLRQRLLSGSLGLAMTGSFTAPCALAHVVAPTNTFVPVTVHNGVSPAIASPAIASPHAAGTVHSLVTAWHREASTVHSPINAVPSAHDLELNNSNAMFSAGSLAGFHNITIDIGGKVQQLNIDSKLTAAELVAAQQVLSGGKQEITINAKGVGTGGYFDLNNTTVSALDKALGGNIGTLDVSRGVQAIDTLSALTLTGSLLNQGTIELGSTVKGQTDVINAASIVNSGMIQSIGHAGGATAGFAGGPSGGLSGAAITLNTSGDFSNSGKITSAGDLNISAAAIANSGTLIANAGNVNIYGVAGGDITFNGTGGTVQAAGGNINFNDAGYIGAGNVTVNGGNWTSQNVNINDGTGTVNASLGQVSGVINGTAGCSHVTADTSNLQLGDIKVSGDPTYYNSGGSITIDGTVSATSGNALAIVASGNIIGSGGKLDTSSGAGGGSLTLIAGANFSPTPVPSSFFTAGGTAAPITIANSTAAGKGSATGGYIDLSGVTLTGKTTNLAVTAVTTNGGTKQAGDILMVAYKGTGANSGSIVATRSSKQTLGATAITAQGNGDGMVTMLGGGAQLTAGTIAAGDILIATGTPSLTTPLKVTDGNLSGGGYSIVGANSNTAINLAGLTSSGNITIVTAGKVSGSAAAPLPIVANGLIFDGMATTSTLFVNSTGVGPLMINPAAASTMNGTLSVVAKGDIVLNQDLNGKGTIDLTAKTGTITGTGVINGTAATLNASGIIGTSPASPLTVAVNTLTVSSSGGAVSLNEGASVGKSLSLLASSSVGAFSLTSAQPITVNGVLTATNNAVSLTETETTTNTINGTTTVAGIIIAKAINVGNTIGSISLTTTGNENILERSVTLTAPIISVTAAAAVGSLSAPLLTNTQSLTIDSNSTNSIFIKDAGTGTFAVSGTSTVLGGAIAIASAAKTFDIGRLDYTNVVIGDSVVGATTTINPGLGKGVGDGTGIVAVSTAGPISEGAGEVRGSAVLLNSSGGDLGATASPLSVIAPLLTANAVKGSVYLAVLGDTNLVVGTALNTYKVADVGSLNLVGSVKATAVKTGTVDLTVSGVMTQTLATTAISAPNVTLTALAGASIGNGVGFQSIQTKATTALTLNGGAGSETFVTQTGSITLGNEGSGAAKSSLNLALPSGSKLTVGGTIGYTNVSLTDPTSVTVGTAGEINTSSLTVTSPVVVVNNINAGAGAGSINIAPGGTASFVSGTALSITGPGVINLGTSLNLSGLSGITLGNASGTMIGLNNPLASIGGTGGGAGPLGDLTIFTKGILTGAYSQFATSAAFTDDVLSITAGSLKNTGAATLAKFDLIGNGTKTNSVSLALTGTQAVTVGTAAVLKGQQPQFDLTVGGSAGGSVSVSAGGTLTVNASGLTITPSTGNAIALAGHALVLSTAVTGLPSTEFSSGKYDSVSLSAASTAFTVGATTATELKNGIAGTIDAKFITISAPAGISIIGEPIQGGQMIFNTSSYKLDSASSITGVVSGSIPNPSLSINNLGAGNLTIVGTVTDPGGTYSGISSVLLQSAAGGINVGQLFTSGTLLGSSIVDSIAISAAGTVTLPTTLSTLGVTSTAKSSIFLNAAAISYSPSSKNLQNFLTLSAPGGTVNLQLKTAVTLGKVRGDFDINAGVLGAYSVLSTSVLTVSEILVSASAQLTGSSITLNDSVTTSGAMQIQATTSQITAGANLISAGSLVLGQVNTTLPILPLSLDTGNLTVVSGALRLNDTFAGDVSVQRQFGISPLNILLLTNSSGSSKSTLTVGSILTTGGGIDIINNNGNIVVAQGASLQTHLGSITLQNNDLNGTIDIQKNVLIHSSGVISNVGQVSIVIGPVPTTTLSAGVQPGPDLPVSSASGAGHIYYTTTTNPFSSITANGLNILNAAGRNVVFNANGNNSAITLEGGDSITADPPPVVTTAPSVSAVTSAFASNLLNASGFNLSGVNAATSTSGFSAANNFDSIVGSSLSSVISVQNQYQYSNGCRQILEEKKPLSGKISNCTVKTMDRGVKLLAPKAQTILNTDFGSVSVAAGSVVMVMAFGGGLAIYNLHDTKSGAVTVNVGVKSVKLAPGQNAVFTDRQIRCFEEINPAHDVAYRCMVSKVWSGGVQGFQSEFSIVSLLQSVGALRDMLKDKDVDTRRAVNSVLKTSAILSQLGGDQYEYMRTPAVTAMVSQPL